MRLTCPNCGVQYEVPDDVIPLAGRNVECSSCGNTWFQDHPEAESSEPDDAFALSEAQASAETSETEDENAPGFEEVEPPDMSLRSEEDSEDQADDGDDNWQEPDSDAARHDDHDDDPDTDAETRSRSGLDPAVADVLRQEAEHEARAREADSLETQPDLGLNAPENEADRRLLQAKARMRRLRGVSGDEAASHDTDALSQSESRRELLPDIEEINSTLRGSGEAATASGAEAASPTEAKRRRGFRLGFAIVLLLALAALIAYSNDDQIAQAYPPAKPYLDTFIVNANETRVWLDSQVTGLFLWLDSVAS